MLLKKIYDVMEVIHSGKKGEKFDNVGKIFVYRKRKSMNYRNTVSHSEIF
jgi:hypothetical protein